MRIQTAILVALGCLITAQAMPARELLKAKIDKILLRRGFEELLDNLNNRNEESANGNVERQGDGSGAENSGEENSDSGQEGQGGNIANFRRDVLDALASIDGKIEAVLGAVSSVQDTLDAYAEDDWESTRLVERSGEGEQSSGEESSGDESSGEENSGEESSGEETRQASGDDSGSGEESSGEESGDDSGSGEDSSGEESGDDSGSGEGEEEEEKKRAEESADGEIRELEERLLEELTRELNKNK